METLELLIKCYTALQIEANFSVSTAIRTDELRATLRNEISTMQNRDGQEVQEEIEQTAFDYWDDYYKL